MVGRINRAGLCSVLHLHVSVKTKAEVNSTDDRKDQHGCDRGKFKRRVAVRATDEPTDLPKAACNHCTILGEFEPMGFVLY